MWLSLCFTLTFVIASQAYEYDVFQLGPLPVGYHEFLSVLTPGLDTDLNVYAPNATGTFPVLLLVGGLGGIIPGFAYSDVLTHVASHGFVAIAVWKVGSPTDSFNSTWMEKTLTFVSTKLEKRLHNQGFVTDMHVDDSLEFIAGHSAGAHVGVTLLKGNCLNFTGLILLSPVDGADPYGIVPLFVINPGEVLNFEIPTVQMVTGLDSIPGHEGYPPCVPEELGNYRFFDALTGPKWLLNATDYGHADFLDQQYVQIVEDLAFCASADDSIDRVVYRNYTAGEIVSFMRGLIYPKTDCHLLANLEADRETVGVDVTTMFVENPNWKKCDLPKCVWKEPELE